MKRELVPGKQYTVLAKTAEVMRLDQFLVSIYPNYSRSFFQKLINDNAVIVNGSIAEKMSLTVRPGDTVLVSMPAPMAPEAYDATVRELGVQVLYEQEHFLVVNKPAGLVVHPPSPHSKIVSLVDWIRFYHAEVLGVGLQGRPGIVHRLDKDTSGVMLIARTPYAHSTLSALFKGRKIQKTYLALVEGKPEPTGIIEYQISRHPLEPHKMVHRFAGGREALTHYTVQEYFDWAALLELQPHTGRTHQIRVHCAAVGHPLLGDTVYGTRSSVIGRQALHAYCLAFEFDGTPYRFCAPLPDDFAAAIDMLRAAKKP